MNSLCLRAIARCLLTVTLLAAVRPASAQVRSIDHRVVARAPYYHTFNKRLPPVQGKVLVLQVRPYDGPGVSPLFDGDAGLAEIARTMDARVRLMDGMLRSDGPTLRPEHWPAIALGDEENVTGEPRLAGNRRVSLSVTHPSREWKRLIQPLLDEAGAGHYVVISLGLAELYLRQDWLGRKSLPIGTGHVVPVNWMNDLESTVGVLSLSGALYNRDGRLIRAGSEGIIAGKPTFWQGVLAKTITGGHGRITTIGDADDPQTVLQTHRRTDLPNAPLAWEVAMDNLLLQLLSRDGLRLPEASQDG